ncbi:hypothetical protein SVA_2915 [Sulfurifustis variabilis]|uniref:Uncharacterized protein n=1 Tax=Sulfurifustis variabilis TaxID=1675686 RepID=A0A1B4V7F1_9GAMM|nr:hypothetical protein [Sulfurifustis variabilis]BAU49463.1 hypothetical protein SVA_2915 [Sulfurifustis variabilis]
MAGVVLHFAGLAADRLGIAMWQADGTGPEPEAVGHMFVTPLRPVTSHYYIASRDHVDPSSRGTARLAEPVESPGLARALRDTGAVPGDVSVTLSLLTPGADREGIEWFYRDGVETRHLAPRDGIALRFRDAPMLALPVPRLVLTEDYRGAASFADVRLSIVSDPFTARLAPRAEGVARRLGEALLDDVGGRALRIVVDAIRFLADTFEGEGRLQGRFAEIPSARIETTD